MYGQVYLVNENKNKNSRDANLNICQRWIQQTNKWNKKEHKAEGSIHSENLGYEYLCSK